MNLLVDHFPESSLIYYLYTNPIKITYEVCLTCMIQQKNNTVIPTTVDSCYLEVEGTLWNTSRYPYSDISDVQNWGKYQSNNQISQMNL